MAFAVYIPQKADAQPTSYSYQRFNLKRLQHQLGMELVLRGPSPEGLRDDNQMTCH